MGDTVPKAHIEHQTLVAEQERRERALCSSVQPAPTNLHTEGGSRPEKTCKIWSESFAWHKQWWQMMLWGRGDKIKPFHPIKARNVGPYP